MDDMGALWGGYLKDLLLLFAGSYMAVLTWVFKRQVGRIDAIEDQHREYITRREFDAKFSDLKTELRDSDKDIQARLDTIVNILLHDARRGRDAA